MDKDILGQINQLTTTNCAPSYWPLQGTPSVYPFTGSLALQVYKASNGFIILKDGNLYVETDANAVAKYLNPKRPPSTNS